MSRNRIKNSQSLHWMGVLKWVLVIGLISVLGLSYMLGKNQNLHLAAETHKLQDQYDVLERNNNDLALDLERMKSPAALARRLASMHSSLVRLDPQVMNIVHREQTTRMRLVRSGTMPIPAISSISVVSSSGGDLSR